MRLRTYPANVCKELRLSSHLISDFSTENSSLITDGAFSTAWLKNFQKPMGSLVFSQENGSGSKYDAFHFCAQPNSIPGAPLGRINALVYATCFADSSSSADTALAYAKLVQHLAVFKGYKGSKPKSKPKKEKTEEERKFRRWAKYFLVTQLVAVLVFLSLLGGSDDAEVELDDDDSLNYND